MLKAHIDFEGGAPADLKKQGLHRWLEHPAVQCWCMSWRMGSVGPVHRWYPGGPDPAALLDHVRAGGIVVAHNAAFERHFWNDIIRRKYAPHWPALRLEQQDCTLARCSALSLPAGLDDAGYILGTAHQKDKDGAALMLKMARPRTVSTCIYCAGDGCADCQGTGESYVWWNEQANLARLGTYCDGDVEAETDIDEKVMPLSAREHRVWMLDQIINDRGIRLDVPLIKRAQALVEHAKKQLDNQIFELTDRQITKATQVAKIKAWITSQGVPVTSLAKGQQEELIALADVFGAPKVEEAIAIRRQAARSSTAKLARMQACMCADGCAYGQLFYHGAHTGRWAGRLIQFQNLYRTDEERDGKDIQIALEILQANISIEEAHDRMATILGEPMTQLAKCMRSMIIARDGKKLVGADLSNIEGCANAWSSGEEWKVQAYRDYQAGNGPDLYRVAYGRSFGVDPADVKGQQRQLGKVQELALGYQGSVGAFYTFTQTYMMKLGPIVATVRNTSTREQWDKAEWLYTKMPAPKKHGLPMDVWAAMRIVVDGWRAAHPAHVASWRDMEDSAIEAMATPPVVVPCLDGKVKYMASNGFLWCQLPSSRVIAYPKAQLKWRDNSTITLLDGTVEEAINYTPAEIERLIREGADYKQRIRRVVNYEGFDKDAGWQVRTLYGGLQSENVNSGIARDILVDCMFDAEDAGYPVILTIHDELLTEVLQGHGSAAELQGIMSRPRAWCPGFPLAAKAWEGLRYGK